MKVAISKHFDFEAAHRLPKVPEGHKCGRMHGHSYRVFLTCECDESELVDGFVVDYAEISDAWAPIFDALDHRTLNEVPGLENPSTEILARWIYALVRRAKLAHFARVAVAESRTTVCTYPAP